MSVSLWSDPSALEGGHGGCVVRRRASVHVWRVCGPWLTFSVRSGRRLDWSGERPEFFLMRGFILRK
jgi:hypothetical protein